MFQRPFSRLRRGSSAMTLIDLIERHISGTGSGFELDDVMSSGRYPEELTDRLYEISQRYRTGDYAVGVANPACFDELRQLALEYTKAE